MKKLLLVCAAVCALMGGAKTAVADTIDPLHLSCSTCGAAGNTFTPILNGQQAVGVTVDETGTNGGIAATDFFLKILVPNSFSVNTEGFTGTIGQTAFSASANLFTSALLGTQWTQAGTFLESSFLGITSFGNGAPPNPIGAFLPSTQGVDPTATGFFVLTLDLGSGLLVPKQNSGVASPFSLTSLTLPVGSWILGDACTSGTLAGGNCTDITTAQSSALFAQPQIANTPLPGAVWLFGGGLALLGWLKTWARRQRGPVSLLDTATA